MGMKAEEKRLLKKSLKQMPENDLVTMIKICKTELNQRHSLNWASAPAGRFRSIMRMSFDNDINKLAELTEKEFAHYRGVGEGVILYAKRMLRRNKLHFKKI